jgi:SAM-dependent methyltransferase
MTEVRSRRLQLGAFDQVHQGWFNTDVTPHLFVARVPGLAWLLHRLGVIGPDRYAAYRSGSFRSLHYLDVGRRFRFEDDTFEAVYASHLLEHLDRAAAERCLTEVYRVLRPGGVVRIAVPDLDAVVGHYDPSDPDAFLAGLYDAHSGRRSRTSLHRWMYNPRSLEALLQRAGFDDVQRCEYQQGRCPDVEQIETRRWSLFMEGVK